MKKAIKIKLSIVYCLILHTTLYAQTYFRGEQTIIQPSQVIVENYTAITLGKEISNEPNANRFDKSNLYTYLQIIHDDIGRDYHILFQTSFPGKIIFLAYSNNLSVLFNNREKPLNVFANCIKQVNDHVSSLQNADAAVKCIIERLNYSSN